MQLYYYISLQNSSDTINIKQWNVCHRENWHTENKNHFDKPI